MSGPEMILSTGAEILLTPEPNGAMMVRVLNRQHGDLSQAEWDEYVARKTGNYQPAAAGSES